MNEIIGRFLATPAVSTTGLAIGAVLVGLWIAGAWWTYADMSRRTRAELPPLLAAAWVILSTPALLPLSLGIYTLVRPQSTLAERRSRSLALSLAPELASIERCPDCGRRVEAEWRRCPSCATWLAEPCAHCGGWAPRDAVACPWCASPRLGAPDVAELPAYQPAYATALAPASWPPAPSLRGAHDATVLRPAARSAGVPFPAVPAAVPGPDAPEAVPFAAVPAVAAEPVAVPTPEPQVDLADEAPAPTPTAPDRALDASEETLAPAAGVAGMAALARAARAAKRAARPQAAPHTPHADATSPGPRRLRRSGTPGAGARSRVRNER